MGIGFPTLLKQHLAIRALPSGHEIDPIMLRGESLDARQSIGYLPTDGVEIVERDPLRHPLLNRLHNRLETIQRFGCLREEADRPVEIQPIQVGQLLNDNGGTLRLTDQAVHLRMALLAIDDQLSALRATLLVAFVDLALQAQDNRTGRVHNGDLVLLRQRIG